MLQGRVKSLQEMTTLFNGCFMKVFYKVAGYYSKMTTFERRLEWSSYEGLAVPEHIF